MSPDKFRDLRDMGPRPVSNKKDLSVSIQFNDWKSLLLPTPSNLSLQRPNHYSNRLHVNMPAMLLFWGSQAPYISIFHPGRHWRCKNVLCLSHNTSRLNCVCFEQAVEDLKQQRGKLIQESITPLPFIYLNDCTKSPSFLFDRWDRTPVQAAALFVCNSLCDLRKATNVQEESHLQRYFCRIPQITFPR